jgi:hypothetical protein
MRHRPRLRGRTAGVQGHGEETLERGTGDTSAQERLIDPIRDLGLVVDLEGADRPAIVLSASMTRCTVLGSSRTRDMWTRKA